MKTTIVIAIAYVFVGGWSIYDFAKKKEEAYLLTAIIFSRLLRNGCIQTMTFFTEN